MPQDKNHFAFFLVRKIGAGGFGTFSFGSRSFVDDVRREWSKASGPDDEIKPENQVASPEKVHLEPDFTHASALTDALSASLDFGLEQHELIEAGSMAPMVMRAAHAYAEVIDPISGMSELVSEDAETALYGLTHAQYADLIKRKEKFELSKKGMERFPTAILLSVVATYDTLIVDILSKMLRLQNDWIEKSERTIPLSKLVSAGSVDEIIREQISEEIYQFSRGSHSEQADYIKRNFGVDVSKNWNRWADYIEIFERRNLVAHGETKFNKRYVNICSKSGGKNCENMVGKVIKIERIYLKNSLDILTEFSILLSFSLFRKFVKDKEEDAFTSLNEAVYKLIRSDHHVIAERLASYALSLEKVHITGETRLMLLVNKASALRHTGKFDEAKKLLDSNDWTAVSDLFKICVASVSGNVEEFKRISTILNKAGVLTGSMLLNWPCFSFMVCDEEVRKFISLEFNLSLATDAADVVLVSANGSESKDVPAQVDSNGDGTVH